MKALLLPASSRLLLLVLLSLLAGPTLAQTGGSVGIGTSAPDASAVLDVAAPNKGLLIPRLDSAARVRIPAPATGLLVFQTNPRAGFYYYAGPAAGWRYLPDQTRSAAGDNLGNGVATTTVNLQGNALVGNGAELPAGVRGVGVRADGGLNVGQHTPGDNLYLGYQAGRVNTTGYYNQFIGYQAGQANTTGYYNQFTGYQSGYYNTTGSFNQFSGYGSGYSNTTGDQNQFSGYESGVLNTAGSNNIFTGYQSGYHNTTGSYNQFSGYRSGYSNATGSYNRFSGYLSGYSNTTGNFNQFNGYRSGYYNTTGSNNWAFGYQAGPTTGNLTNAGAIGYQAQVSQSNSLVLGGTGANAVNVGIGTTAPYSQLSNTSDNVVGSNGFGVSSPSLTWSSPEQGYTAAFYNGNTSGAGGGALAVKVASASAGTAVLDVSRGSTQNTTGTTLLLVRADGNVGIGTSSPGYMLDVAGTIRGNNVSPSDMRFKQQVRPLAGALAGALALRGVRYRWNALGVAHGGVAGAEQVGLLAQEVEKVYPELVSTDAQGYKAVNYAQLTPVLLEAIRELAAQNEALQAQLRQQQQRAEASTTGFEQRLRALEGAADRAAR
ncbi:tail fiber domain-containing protein [Hymenobacter aerilatus]|uniref:Tail fiber domain-containing protein n=1 Tax=Hymenobacter aerilatus TaxID=2932251 RepID=A0A8T9T2U0_9BACT|nr:tail fiber domain-containing protein [Hymenobacter aerilatus]UOR06436.1 tail fiber domain-containing protein [Hymenobacter aerilatus]